MCVCITVIMLCIRPCQAVPDNVHQLHVQQPSTYEKQETAYAVLGS